MQNEIITENVPKILIVGWGRCGKDESGKFLDSIGLPYGGSTSWAALPFMAKALNMHPQLAWEHRHEHRQSWKDYCDYLRRDDPCFLIRLALRTGKIVTGVRDIIEIQAAKRENLFDHIVWIHRPGIPEDFTVTFGPDQATAQIVNGGDIPSLHSLWMNLLGVWGVKIQRN